MTLAPSTKERLIRQSLKLIERLGRRLVTCDINDVPAVQKALNEEREVCKILMEVPTKPRRTRGQN